MLTQISQDFKKLFLLEFTNQLIRASNPTYFLKEQIHEILEEKKDEKHSQEIKIKTIRELKKQAPEIFNKPYLHQSRTKEIRSIPPRVLRVPEPRLPRHLQYLRPVPKPEIKIDLGRLSPLIQDVAVQEIECNGPETKIIVRVPQEKSTSIVFSKEEIDEVIGKFEQESKIPADEGFYRVVAGTLVFSAIISEITGSRFLIKKMPAQRQMPQGKRVQEFRPMARMRR